MTLDQLAEAGLIDPGWAGALAPVGPRIAELGDFLRAETAAGRGYLPSGDRVLRAFGAPMEDVRVLIKTPNSRLWGSPEFNPDYVGVTEAGAKHLVGHGIKVLGVDYLSVEPFNQPGAPAHRALLGGGTIVIEGLNLRDVEPGVYEMFCLPLRIVGADGAPARVVLRQS